MLNGAPAFHSTSIDESSRISSTPSRRRFGGATTRRLGDPACSGAHGDALPREAPRGSVPDVKSMRQAMWPASAFTTPALHAAGRARRDQPERCADHPARRIDSCSAGRRSSGLARPVAGNGRPGRCRAPAARHLAQRSGARRCEPEDGALHAAGEHCPRPASRRRAEGRCQRRRREAGGARPAA